MLPRLVRVPISGAKPSSLKRHTILRKSRLSFLCLCLTLWYLFRTTLSFAPRPHGATQHSLLSELEPLPASSPLSQYPTPLGGRWASGYPRMNLSLMTSQLELKSGVQLRLYRENVTELRDAVLALDDTEWTDKVQKLTNAYIKNRQTDSPSWRPGTASINLIWSNNDGTEVYQYPWYERFTPLVEPLVEKLLGSDAQNVARIQLSRMPVSSKVNKHSDLCADNLHRIHIVLITVPGVDFYVCDSNDCVPISLEDSLVFEFNNKLLHYASNHASNGVRIHLILDVADEPRQRKILEKGASCTYLKGGLHMTCDNIR